jgi:hypothetical protein
MSKEDQETVILFVQTLGVFGLWYILEWYKEKAGQKGD